eukprot:TRINITY_DN3036_c0_g1_i1.p1 TRINITY_DN3036_c0_g1~~TRINITY_DN3036_c0_g1_i1.p1  ORF type:complete len:641 (-),score=108.55 TRINITY_DN3036_c0_g1_i1:351-2273(-)
MESLQTFGSIDRLHVLDELLPLPPFTFKQDVELDYNSIIHWIAMPPPLDVDLLDKEDALETVPKLCDTNHDKTSNSKEDDSSSPFSSSNSTPSVSTPLSTTPLATTPAAPSDLEVYVHRMQEEHIKAHQRHKHKREDSIEKSEKKESSKTIEHGPLETSVSTDSLHSSTERKRGHTHSGLPLLQLPSRTVQPCSTEASATDGEPLLSPSPYVKTPMTQRIVLESKDKETSLSTGVKLFNEKPLKGLEYLWNEEIIGRNPEDVATFFHECNGLDKTQIGEFLASRDSNDFSLKVLDSFVGQLNFNFLDFDIALRRFLYSFRLPGEAQKIDRVLSAFAEHYYKTKVEEFFLSSAVVHVLAFSTIMLNTDIHNPNVKNKMTLPEFIKNNKGINEGTDLPLEFIEDLYQRIKQDEIKFVKDAVRFPNAVKKGWVQMFVKGTMSASFKRRWCVLSDDCFHIFKKIEDSKPTTLIQLKNYTLTTHLGPADLKTLRGRKHCIKLVSNQSSEVTPKIIRKNADKESPIYLLSFASQKEVTSWVNTINAHVLTGSGSNSGSSSPVADRLNPGNMSPISPSSSTVSNGSSIAGSKLLEVSASTPSLIVTQSESSPAISESLSSNFSESVSYHLLFFSFQLSQYLNPMQQQ